MDAVDEAEGSSRASSPSKSPLLQSAARYLDQSDQPLLRQPPGRAVRLSHQSGSDAGEHPLRPAMQLGTQPQQHQPSSPPMSQAQYNSWYQQGADSRAADRAAAAAPGVRADRGPPNRRTLFGQQATEQQYQQQQQESESIYSDGGTRQQQQAQYMFGAAAAASDPRTYQPIFERDAVPNMGDVTHDNGGPGWQIPAMRPTNTPPSAQQTRHSPAPSISGGPGRRADKKTPGAVVKLGRRQAWLKYLAYEVRQCWLLQSSRSFIFLSTISIC